MDAFDHDFERGQRNRRAVLGDAWVDRAAGGADTFNADFQNTITRIAWHEVWGRPGLDAKTRRVIVLATTVALGRWEEFGLHCRAALSAGTPDTRLTPDELKEVLLQMAIYAGVPAANTAMAHAGRLLRELGMAPEPLPASHASHPGVGRPVRVPGHPALHATVREARNGAARGTLVLAHALGCDASLWDALANTLAADHRVVAYDARGHGESDVAPGACRMASLADDAARVIDTCAEGGPVVFIGISMGGMVAQELALRHPAQVRALVVSNASPGYDAAGRTAWEQRIETVRASGMEPIADGAMARWFGSAFHAEQPATVARWRRRVVSTDAEGYVAACDALMHHDTTTRLGQIGCPVLVIAGECDPATPPSMSEMIAASLPNARLVVMPGAAHLTVLEQPAAYAALVRAFLDEVEGAGAEASN